jgi:hypothetical protein
LKTHEVSVVLVVPSECQPSGADEIMSKTTIPPERNNRTGLQVGGVNDVLKALEKSLLGDGENVVLHRQSDKCAFAENQVQLTVAWAT